MMSVLGARARCSGNSKCSFFQGARAPSTYRALSHNFPGIEVFIQNCLYFKAVILSLCNAQYIQNSQNCD